MDEFRIFLAELGENSRFAAAGIAVEEKELMLGVCLTQFPFRANMVVKIHVWRLEEGVFHSIDSDDIPGFAGIRAAPSEARLRGESDMISRTQTENFIRL